MALPTIGPALHVSSSDLQWFVDAYSLVVAAALLPAALGLPDQGGTEEGSVAGPN